MIEKLGDGSTVFTGDDTKVFALLALRSALTLEVKGLRASRGSAYRTVKSRYGYRGNKAKVLAQFTEDLTKAGVYHPKPL